MRKNRDTTTNCSRLSLKESTKLLSEARRLIPLASQTFSKSAMAWSEGACPQFVTKGKGARVWDVDGNEYLDFSMGLGAQILGHAHPAIVKAVSAQVKKGLSFSLATPLELELAKLIVRHVPSAEMVRFGKNGSDATSVAVRIARAATGRDQILCGSYHGWQDWYVGTTTRNAGVPKAVCQLTTPFPYGDISALEKLLKKYKGKVAGVIMEPMITTPPPEGYLKEVKRLTHKHGAILIFDEIITGFRFGMGGAQEYYGVLPDLTCLGKGLGNGMPIAAICGKKRLMKLLEKVFFSFTHGGETASLAAGIALIHTLESKPVHAHINRLGLRLNDGTRKLIGKHGLEKHLALNGFPYRAYLGPAGTGPKAEILRTYLQQEMVKAGILFNGQHFVSYAHKAGDIRNALEAYDAVFGKVADAIAKRDIAKRLDGKPLTPVFRPT
jgi:glutamate-1-semialdehyde-2,1-aminomutase